MGEGGGRGGNELNEVGRSGERVGRKGGSTNVGLEIEGRKTKGKEGEKEEKRGNKREKRQGVERSQDEAV